MSGCVNDYLSAGVIFLWAGVPNEGRLDPESRTEKFIREEVMFISADGLQAMHQDIVNDDLR